MYYITNLFHKIIVLILLLDSISIIQCHDLDREFLYHSLKNILDLYKRPITVLDIHATDGYFSFNIAQEYDTTCVMLEDDYNNLNHLLQEYYSQANGNNNIILLKKNLSIEDLERLASCEYFDIVLALNGINHSGSGWKKAINAILHFGNNIIMGVSDISLDTNQQKNYLIQHGCHLWLEHIHVNDQKTRSLFWCIRQKTSLDRHHWLGKEGYSDDYFITSNFNKKTIYKHNEHKTYPWIRGINLLTFKMLEGILPDKNLIKNRVKNMSGIVHEDFMLWNMIIQGTEIVPIDFSMKSGNPFDTEACISFDLGMIEQDSSIDVMQWFKNHWPHFIASHKLDIPLNFYDCK